MKLNYALGVKSMEKTIRAKVCRGLIEPLEDLDLEDGTELKIVIVPLTKLKNALRIIRTTAGAWKGTINAEELKNNIYSDRLINSRIEPRL